MRYQMMKKQVRKLIAVEGYLELGLAERAVRELHEIDHSEMLRPYAHFLLGQAYRQLERYEDAINPLHEAARTIPAPLNRQAWLDLGDCFRREGQNDLAEIVEMFAEDVANDAGPHLESRDFAATPFDGLEVFAERDLAFPLDDFAQYNFEPEGNKDITQPSAHRNRPQK